MKRLLLALLCLSGMAHAQDLIITEIMYNPPESGTDTSEFVEIYNNSGGPIDLTGYTIGEAFVYSFPSIILPADAYFVIATDITGFTNTYGFAPDGVSSSGALSNAGEDIVIYDNLGATLDSVYYDDVAPWPFGTGTGDVEGGGASLELCNYTGDNNDGANWQASTNATGIIINTLEVLASPGASNNCCVAVYGTDTQVSCVDFMWIDGMTYTTNNNSATHTLVGGAVSGCDSIVTLDLTILPGATGTDVQTACETYTWIDGMTYTANNNSATYVYAGGAANGCDSTVTLDLTITNAATGTDVQTACDTYTWIDGMTYTASNNTATYTFVGGAASGCDSIVTLDLTINTLDLSVVNASPTLTANATGVSYQWVECGTFGPIAGETGQSFTATANGDYAVIIDDGTCADTSACETVSGVGIADYGTMNVVVSPNPSNGAFMVSLDGTATYTVTDLSGKIMFSGTLNQSGTIDLTAFESGIYLLVLNQEGNREIIRLVRQ